MKLREQIFMLAFVTFTFLCFDIFIFQFATKRCLPDQSEGMQAKSVELGEYLPFDEDSKIVNIKSELPMTGELPVIDGAAALYPVFSAFVNAVYPEESVVFDGTDFTSESCLQMRNTRGAYQAVVDGTADIVICAKPSEEQLQYAADHNVELELVPIGYEAFVFLVNGKNPVDDLTIDQIKGIYNGTYLSWRQLGGDHYLINPLQRNEGSGSQTRFLAFMDGENIVRNRSGFLGSPIGFSFRYYVEEVVEHGNIKMLSINGVYPSRENVANGTYPIVNNFYAVYDKANDNPNVQLMIEWMLSEDAQQIINETGYVGLY